MDEILKRIQNTELEILIAVNSFCIKNNIKYSLTYGTLIGAVRHGGFIPWDDDIDLMMERSEYERFISAWKIDHPNGLFLQTDETDPGYVNNFLKIRKEGTTFIQSEAEKKCTYHTGIFIDIFPVDRVAPKGINRKMQYLFCQIDMLMTRNHPSGKSGFGSMIEKLFLSLPVPIKKYIKNYSFGQKTKWNDSQTGNLPLFWNGTIHGANTYFRPDLFNHYISLNFEGHSFMVVSGYHQFLKDYFGDYMKLPPEDKRVTHHPIVVDFEKEYEKSN